MGVEGFYSYEKRLAGAPAPVQIHSILNDEHEVHVDLVGLFFNIIRRTIKSDLAHPLRTTPKFNELPKVVAFEVDRVFGHANRHLLTLHVDGQDCREKERARAARDSRVDQAVKTADKIIPPVDFTQPHLPPPPTAAKEHRFKAAVLQVFRLDYSCKVWLANGLLALGMNVCKCSFEADTCIAATFKARKSAKSLVAVSGDSDFRIYEDISTV
ncbi:hypothetical protein DFQ27_001702, partial [Actinomortierella ambigua]